MQAKGESFVFEKTGQPVKFWATNTLAFQDHERVDRLARHLAKRGVKLHSAAV